jgi:hypothetical protein
MPEVDESITDVMSTHEVVHLAVKAYEHGTKLVNLGKCTLAIEAPLAGFGIA